MCFRVVFKVGRVLGLSSALLAGTCLLFLVEESLAQNSRLGAVGNPSGIHALTGHVPAATAPLSPLGEVPASQRLALAISLPVRDPGRLEQLLRELYDPTSTNYHRYLTPEQFRDQFGALESDYAAVVAFARANQFIVTRTHPNRLVLDVSATAADVKRAFNLTLRVYKHPTENRNFFAPDAEPTLQETLPVLRISGLDSYSMPLPHYRVRPLGQTNGPQPRGGSGASGTYFGNDFRAAYVPGTPLTGTGQSVGLLEFDGYYASDISAYESQMGLSGGGPQLVNVAVDGGVSKPGSGNIEVALDIEMAVAMAPGLSKIYVYEAPNPSPWVDLLSQMANDNLAKQLSCSWGGGSADPASEQIFQQMAAQGQSFFNASGDSDAFTGTIPFPSDSPNIIQVGGTTLTTGAGGSYSSETVWNWGRGTGSSGGISTTYGIPSWQQSVSMAQNQGSTTMRNVPDVALTADNIYTTYNSGSAGSVGGTSAAAPLWAAFTALVNQQAASAGHAPVGFLNPALYTIGTGPNYGACFLDTTTGNNTSRNSRNKFFAVAGYDLCTGWGTPNGTNLINALAPIPPPLVAAFGAAPTTGAAPLNVTFTDNSSGAINSRHWNFGDGVSTNTSATTFVFTYGSPGTNTVSLTVSGSGGTNTFTQSAYVVVTNSATVVLSNLPSITAQPQAQVVLAGMGAVFTVQAAGALPLTYQWCLAGTQISGATGSGYALPNVQPQDGGLYDVVVTNGFGSVTSSVAKLSVVNRPSLVSPSLTSNGMFTFLLSGDAGFNYAIERTTNLSDWSVVATLTNAGGLVPYAETNSQDNVLRAYRARLVP
jgi:subtilase family serine protease